MPLKHIEHLYHPDGGANADGWHCDESTALLLDGATPSAPTTVTPYVNDTVWLVRRFVELWPRLALRASDIAERVELARLALRDEYASLCARTAAPEDAPFACLAIAHDAGEQLELYNMGDLTLLLRAGDGSLRRFGESAVRQLDQRAIEGLRRALASGVTSHAERMHAVAPELRDNRALRNVLPGYEVLEPGVSCLGRFQRLSCARGDVRALLLMSDGFYRLVDTFERYTDRSLFDAVEERGLAPLLDELRGIEVDDEQCVRYPRFKTHDDATALWLELS